MGVFIDTEWWGAGVAGSNRTTTTGGGENHEKNEEKSKRKNRNLTKNKQSHASLKKKCTKIHLSQTILR